MRASVTKQIDGGMRYRIMRGLNFLAGAFEVTKPYFDRNTANIYGDVGSPRHRGIETSLTRKPIENVTVVAGAVFLQARVSGLPVDQGLIGENPPGTPPWLVRINVQYDVPGWHGFAVDSQMEIIGSRTTVTGSTPCACRTRRRCRAGRGIPSRSTAPRRRCARKY